MMWEKLLAILHRQNRLYDRINQSLESQQQAIVADDMETLEPLTEQAKQLYEISMVLEKERMAEVDILADQLAVPAESLSLRVLREYLPEALRLEYDPLAEALKKNIHRAKEMNQTNNDLLKMSLRYIDVSLNLLTGNSHPSYGSQGQEHDNQGGNSLLNYKA